LDNDKVVIKSEGLMGVCLKNWIYLVWSI